MQVINMVMIQLDVMVDMCYLLFSMLLNMALLNLINILMLDNKDNVELVSLLMDSIQKVFVD